MISTRSVTRQSDGGAGFSDSPQRAALETVPQRPEDDIAEFDTAEHLRDLQMSPVALRHLSLEYPLIPHGLPFPQEGLLPLATL
jgi:hypothetical protein